MSGSIKNMNEQLNKMYYSREDRVKQFNEAAGGKKAEFDDPEEAERNVYQQLALFDEEVHELKDSLDIFFETLYNYVQSGYDENEATAYQIARAEMVKEWADCQVTLSNLAWVLDIDGNEAFQRVHNSNMGKLQGGKIVIDPETRKVQKPETYSPPNMMGL